MNALTYLAYVLITCLGFVLVVAGLVGITVVAGIVLDRRKRTDRVGPLDDRIDILAEHRREDGTYPPPPQPPVGGSGQATARDLDLPPGATWTPLDLPTPTTTDQLRIYTADFGECFTVPTSAKQCEEGTVILEDRGPAFDYIVAELRSGRVDGWLTVTRLGSRWLGRLDQVTLQSEGLSRKCIAVFTPNPVGPGIHPDGFAWVSSTHRSNCPACQVSYPQA